MKIVEIGIGVRNQDFAFHLVRVTEEDAELAAELGNDPIGSAGGDQPLADFSEARKILGPPGNSGPSRSIVAPNTST